MLRLGISPFATTRTGALDVARTAVAGGLGTLWLGDGLLASDDFPGWSGALEPFAELAWLAGAVDPHRVGLTAAVLPLRDVVNVAKQAATLDVITEGRFVLVVAPGYWDREFAFRGVPIDERAARFDDAVGALRALWRGDPYDGPFHQVPAGDVVSPAPITPGGPPLWLAGGPATMRRALRAGLPYQPSRMLPDALAPLAAEWFEGGGGELGLRIRVEVSDAPPRGHDVDWQALAGPPDHLATELARYAELGVTDVSIVPGQDDATSLATVERLVADVLPTLRAAGLA
ncbi:MAG: LLM class flavin-dependent oxidoreductase [Acidimicrobiales bacterium]|nr:LLM class flavin-dependent oxidoreductase [Acidimicrobiales bacterium]MCB9393408.1 LLM class flavin-dependent oxidoreductase [Acidimicrobiaceae bacterium]